MKLPPHSEKSTLGQPILEGNRNCTVMLFGEVLADNFPDRSVLGGAPFNVARHLREFEQNPVLITRLGNDILGDEVLDVMKQNGMDTSGVQCDGTHPTGQVQVHIEKGGHRFEILPLQAYDFIDSEEVRSAALSLHPALVYFGTLAQRHETSVQSLKVMLSSTEAVRFLDINLRAPWYDEKILRQSLQYADIVKLNDEELGVLAKLFGLSGGDPQNLAKELMSQFGLHQAVVTCGEKGAWQINRDGTKVEAAVKDPIAKLVDTVGAGDGFSAVFILGVLRNWPMDRTLERANAFAAAICGTRGAIPDHADFYKPFIRDWDV